MIIISLTILRSMFLYLLKVFILVKQIGSPPLLKKVMLHAQSVFLTKGIYNRLAQVPHLDSYLSLISLPCQIFILILRDLILSHLASIPGHYAN